METITKRNETKLFTFNADPGVKEVRLAGDFNKWDPEGLPMTKRAGMFVRRVDLGPGEHQYKFLVDGQWTTDPVAEMQVPNGLGSMNSVVSV
jgi:5'-AMP-activated protein kinase, regulatory beta subunit